MSNRLTEGQVVLVNVNLEIMPGSITALIGPSGAGKTSLLRLLNRLDDPTSGEIFYGSRPLIEYPVQTLRRQVGFVFQTPIMFSGTVSDNLRIALEIAGQSTRDFSSKINEVLAFSELESSMAQRDAAKLSVGQKQRVSIARALMTAPKVLLMDEPTSALDPETADRLMETIRRLGTEKGITVIMITHRLTEASRVSDFAVYMENGRVVESGTADVIFGLTENPRIREYLDSGKY